MNKHVKTTAFFNQVSAILLILALTWFSVGVTFNPGSRPFDILNKIESTTDTPEEKVPTSNLLSEEYLHDHHQHYFYLDITATAHFLDDACNYPAFHGELQVPPPKIS